MYTLILFFYVGIFGDTDSNATTSVPGFYTEEGCKRAGQTAKKLTSGTKKETKFVCVKLD